MEWIVADLKIAVVLLAWIVAMVGVGNVVYNILNSRKTKENSSLGESFRPFENFECLQTQSLASRPKFSKEAKASTASRRLDERSEVPNTRILGESQELQGDSVKTNRHYEGAKQPKQSIESVESQSDSNIIDCHEALTSRNDGIGAFPQQNIKSRNDGITSSLRGDNSPKQSINANNLAESRRSERVENAESKKDSNDSIDSTDSKTTVDCHDLTSSSLAMTVKGDSIESTKDSNIIDCHEALTSRNDGIDMNSHANPCGFPRNDGISVDFHDSAMPNLAMTKNDAFAESRNDNSTNDKQGVDSSHSMQSPTIFPDNFAIRIFASLLFGVIIVSFLTSLLHLFFPITSIFSVAFLVLGIALFALKIRDFHLLDFRVLFSGAVAFAIVAILGFFHDSIGDSVNYHIQIVTWIQNSPLIFGLGNIHGRLGFNGIIYNFYALSDVSQIFPSLRSFIANEIIYFAFIFAVVHILATGAFKRFYLLFIVCCAIPFSFVLKWAEFNGLYCEGIGLVFGVFVGAMVCYVIESHHKKGANSHEENSSLGESFRPFENFEHSQTHSLASRPKFSKEAKAFTASRRLDERSEVPNTRILEESQELQGDSAKDSIDSIESNRKMDCHDLTSSSLAMTKNDAFKASRNDASLSSLRGDNSPKQSINANNLAESRRSERVENAESQKDSNDSTESNRKMDCHDLTSSSLAMTVKGDSAKYSENNSVNQNNPHEVRTASRSASWCIKRGAKEAEVLPLFLCKKRNQARHSPKSETAAAVWRVGERGGGAALFAKKCDYVNESNLAESRRSERVESFTKSAESQKDSNIIDCHEALTSRNDGIGAFPQQNIESRNDASTSSLRGSPQGLTKRALQQQLTHTCKSIKNANFIKTAESLKDSSTHFSNALLFILFIISVFAAQVKIANTALCLCVAIIFIYLNRDFYRIKFYKKYAILGILCVIFVLPWAIKGVATSGMVAYPAGIFFFESLPFAVSEAQRESEVCWIMSWARAPGKNCVEVLANSAWVGEWFSMKTRYFGWYFKYFVYNFFASLALLSVIIIYAKAQKRRIESTKYLIVFLAFFAGAIFWFFSGPDPRFGMVYIFPLIGILLAFNITEIKNIASKKARIIFIVALLLTLMPFWKLTRDMYIILILLCVLLPSLSAKWRKIYYALIIILSFVSIPNIYRKQLGSIKQLPKVLPIYAKERITDYGVSVFHRSDELKEGYKSYDYEPMPTTPYFSSHIKEERFLGRKAYIDTNKESK